MVSQDLDRMHDQLANFSVREAKCFCCSLPGHWHAETGKMVPCDRVIVHQAMRTWFAEKGRRTETGGMHLNFDRHVQTELGPQVWAQIGGNLSRYVQTLAITSPWLWFAAGFLDMLCSMEPQHAARFAMEAAVMYFAGFPATMQLIFALARRTGRFANEAEKSGKLVRMLATPFYIAAAALICGVVWGLILVTRILENPAPQAVVLTVFFLMPFYLFRGNYLAAGAPLECRSSPRPSLLSENERRPTET